MVVVAASFNFVEDCFPLKGFNLFAMRLIGIPGSLNAIMLKSDSRVPNSAKLILAVDTPKASVDLPTPRYNMIEQALMKILAILRKSN